MSRFVFTLAACWTLSATALAHDFWIQPSRWHAGIDAPLSLTLRVGDAFAGEELPRDPERLERFVVLAPGAEERPADVLGFAGRSPAGLFRPRAAGLHAFGYVSHSESLLLPAALFEYYLREEGLEHVSEARKARGERRAPGRERFRRSAKTLVPVGAGAAGDHDLGWDRRLGLPLELVPLADPFTLRPDAPLELELLYQNEPLAGVYVTACRASAPEQVQGARTDARGRVRFTLAKADAWLVSGVHMVRTAEDEADDWESTWTSLTFEIEEPASER